jgi:hypothetical protein
MEFRMSLRLIFNLILAFLFVLSMAAGAQAQEDESVQLGVVETTGPTQLRVRPSGTAAVALTLPARTRLAWVAGQRRNGFVRVLTRRGPQGWVSEASTRLVSPPPSLLLETSPPCAPNLTTCPVNGCSSSSSAHGLFNRTKRRFPGTATARPLSFADFDSIQTQATNLVGQAVDLTSADRNRLQHLQVSQGTVREGSLVMISGFIAQGLEPHANSGESVNCRRTAVADNDFHISLAARANQDEFAGIVVEMIPQDRPAGWTLSKLKTLKTQGRRVLVIGALFYDNAHVVNDDPENPLQGQPRRFSIWEVHPITKFLVCRKANNACTPSTPSDWLPLESL